MENGLSSGGLSSTVNNNPRVQMVVTDKEGDMFSRNPELLDERSTELVQQHENGYAVPSS